MKKKAFTLLEIIVVVVVLGFLASVGLVKYTKVVDRGRENMAIINLKLLNSALETYYSRARIYPQTLMNLTGLNNVLGLSVEDTVNTYVYYAYSESGVDSYLLYATAPNSKFSVLTTSLFPPKTLALNKYSPDAFQYVSYPAGNLWGIIDEALVPAASASAAPPSWSASKYNPCCRCGSCPTLPSCYSSAQTSC